MGEDGLEDHFGCEGLEVTGVPGTGYSRGVQSSRALESQGLAWSEEFGRGWDPPGNENWKGEEGLLGQRFFVSGACV